jgi:hypothetical protein
VISFLNLFLDLAPALARRNRNDEIRDCSKGVHARGEETLNRIREISVRELARLKEFPVIVDVREEEEFCSGHIEGARNVSRAALEQTVSEKHPTGEGP